MTTSILVPSHVQSKVGRKLDRLAKKAGVSVELIEGTTTLFERAIVDGKWAVEEGAQALECARYTIGELPRFNGFVLVAKIAHTEGGNVISKAPDFQKEELPFEMRTAKPTCDHCKTKRMRAETFVIRTPEGELYRIGRNCLADFLKTDPGAIVAAAELAELAGEPGTDDERGWGGGGYGMSTSHYLACAVSAVEHHGFKKSAEDGATKGHAYFLANPKPKGDTYDSIILARTWTKEQPTKEHYALAARIMLWAKTVDAGPSDYIHNLKVALACGALSDRAGLVASAPSAYARALGREEEKKQRDLKKAKREATPDGGYLGTIKERIDIPEAKLVWIGECVSEAGWEKTILTFVTPSNQTLVWFASGSHPMRGDVGRRFSLRGTVTKHKAYKGKAQTSINRVKFEALDKLPELTEEELAQLAG
jgi:hypothetical protein